MDSNSAAPAKVPETTQYQQHVWNAITGRHSTRSFLETPVSKEVVADVLRVASRAPSGSNMQPWCVYVLREKPLAAVTESLCDAFDRGDAEHREYQYYPAEWRSPYVERRRAAGWGLFARVGVVRGDRKASARQRRRNFEFFGAPVGLIFTIDDDLETGSWIDYGIFLQSVMIAARGAGLATCPQAAIANYPHILRQELPIGAHETVVCGMALGYEDPEHDANDLVTERATLEEFATFIG